MSSLVGNYYFSGSVSGSNYYYNTQPILNSKVVQVLFTSPVITMSAASQFFNYTFPTTLNSASFTKAIVTDCAARLVSGSPGSGSNFGLAIGGVTIINTRPLPPFTNNSDVTFHNFGLASTALGYKMCVGGDTILIASGGTYAAAGNYQFDLIGYYF